MVPVEPVAPVTVLSSLAPDPLPDWPLSGVRVAIAVATTLSVPTLHYLTHHGLNVTRFAGISLQGVAWDPMWRASVSVRTYTGPIVTLAVVVLLAALYPAIKAAMIRPVDAIRHQ